MKVSQAKIRDFLKKQLSTNSNWALRGLVRIYERQTADEQAVMRTEVVNGVGFTGCDAEILSSFAEQYKRRGTLSEKQMVLVFKKMPRYWKQISSLIPKETIEQLVISN